jgi:hypothetical protein
VTNLQEHSKFPGVHIQLFCRVNKWLAEDATAEERAACSLLFRLLSKSTADQPVIGGMSPNAASRPATANLAGRNVSRPSSAASRPRSAVNPSRTLRPSSAGQINQPSPHGPRIRHCITHGQYNLLPRPGSSQGVGVKACHERAPTNLWATTNDTFYGFRSQYPDIFNEVEATTRVQPAGNHTFLSEFAESMKNGCSNWKQYLKTTTETVNRSVFSPSLSHNAQV